MTIELEGDAPWSRKRRIGHYGGAVDKVDTSTERVPYAWERYRELQAMRGSAFSYDATGYVHAENLATARLFAGLERAAEKVEANSLPGTADEKLEEWVETLRLPVAPDDTRQDIRQRAAVAYLLPRGASPPALEALLDNLLGDNFVGIVRTTGVDLDTPPTNTYWPTINPGPSNQDLGGGAWASDRAHLTFQVTRLAGQSSQEFSNKLNVIAAPFVDRVLPSDKTWSWSIV